MILIAISIKCTSIGPVFYKSKRAGKDGEIFDLLKFRSMVENASKLGPGITRKEDPRVTKVGRFLRKYKFDELPQFINVLRGEMSIVGPRPEDPEYVKRYNPEQRKVLSVKPGITSAASIKYRHEEQILNGENWESLYFDEIMPEKLNIDLEYVNQKSFFMDLKIIIETILVILK